MPVKIVPREIAVEFRAYVVKFAFMIAIPFFVALVFVGEAVNAWNDGNPGNTIVFGAIAFGFTFLTGVLLFVRIGKHEMQLNHSAEEMQFLTDAEAVQLGYMPLKTFMEKHKVMNTKMLRMYAQYLHDPITEPYTSSAPVPSTAPNPPPQIPPPKSEEKKDEVTHVTQ